MYNCRIRLVGTLVIDLKEIYIFLLCDGRQTTIFALGYSLYPTTLSLCLLFYIFRVRHTKTWHIPSKCIGR